MADSKNKIEAALYSSGKKMSIEELSKITRTPQEEVTGHLRKLKEDYESRDSSLLLSDEGDGWKITVRQQYTPVVRKIVAETELTRSLMETLAVIALKAPALQSEVIKFRTNKAYDHLSELEKAGFISRTKHSRTKLIRLTDRFFNYFEVKNSDEIKEKFRVQEPVQASEGRASGASEPSENPPEPADKDAAEEPAR